jgi:hypothetical protein
MANETAFVVCVLSGPADRLDSLRAWAPFPVKPITPGELSVFFSWSLNPRPAQSSYGIIFRVSRRPSSTAIDTGTCPVRPFLLLSDL